jgi:hypothetical protein
VVATSRLECIQCGCVGAERQNAPGATCQMPLTSNALTRRDIRGLIG